jgi:serine/threonine-protein kinase
VALKVVKRGMDTDEVLRRFLAERRILAQLTHPHIARLLDGGVTEDGRPYFAMEHVDGTPIVAYCLQGGLPLEARLRLFQDVCDAVSYAHRNLVVHRDLKPSNIMLVDPGSDREQVKVLDFGIAKVFQDAGDARQLTLEGQFAGTPAYIAPEVVRGQPATARSDIYALGGVLYFLLARKPPFEGATTAVLLAHVQEEPVPPSAKRGQPLPAEVEAIVLRCLAKEPAERFASAEDLARALQACAGEVVASGARDPVSRS